MNTQEQKDSWVVEQSVVPEAAPVAQVRRRVLSLYPRSALFETGTGFQAVDGKQTMFMVDLLFELILVDGTWQVFGSGPFEMKTSECNEVVNDHTKPLWERMRKVTQILALPEGFPLVLVLGYSAARFVEHLPRIAIEKGEPEVVLRVYRHVVRYNGAEGGAQVDVLKCRHDEVTDTEILIATLTDPEIDLAPRGPWDLGVIQGLTERSTFCDAVNRAKEHIRAGDIYQVQLCRCAISSARIPPLDLYERLASINPAPYMYYLDLGDRHVVSSSPELMIRSGDGGAQVRPIAGTMAQEDQRGSRLDHIPKEAAEHLMLVDLARNDLARCAIPGGVDVTSFMQMDAYGPLFHLVSTVETPVRADSDIWDLIEANFPAGTMTGAPKVRAMEIIAELEDTARGLFTGCAGYINGENSGVLALTIRTIVGDSGRYVLRAAAGIVADSKASAEWDEAGAKIRSFARAIGGSV
ncbi:MULTISPECIES: anthranilate synthase component I family protein [Bacillus]|uniref:anthranilate synthase component I family protein n=1 Tax=Bacillus TaxID=1386 RepID=UPI000779A915|nr:anthranilate synthase component I family protein [Bacillus amyloliquefaciens]KYC95428.1 Anthranilate synthase, aminase component [Bacillus amyloliquefaciens]MBW8281701.1 anthranilate synthase component I family protein [Bacillus amyloliquefaciens]MEC1248497.1 anthranilate synthase component I family protein [Bacillus amyloliquefaciens]MEC2251784.1 anthranilate synthase component I family protein [Bacillus amyloliquefaciens]MED0830936.1 anthranilate synthase component I family protein [Bacil